MSDRSSMAEQRWPGYVASFHAERAGITEDVLEHALDEQRRTPYDWAAEALGTALGDTAPAKVLDLACGSAPMSARLARHVCVGMDLSAAELARARARGLPVAVADAGRLPLPDGSVDAVVMSMALMLVPLREASARTDTRPLPPTPRTRAELRQPEGRHPRLHHAGWGVRETGVR